LPSSTACCGPAAAAGAGDHAARSGQLGTLALKTYMRAVVPAIARVVARQHKTSELWRYYWDTIEACVPPDAVLAALRAAGFRRVRRYVELGDLLGIHRVQAARRAHLMTPEIWIFTP
jgi:ubiquinone/menaquinone biosynthesis C-methylase UbiE